MKDAKTLPIWLACSLFFSLSSPCAQYYWVGGAGNWSELTNWATTSGGTVRHNSLPTANDDVIFDANSFNTPGQVVFVNSENAFCRSMIWRGVTGIPVFRGPETHVLNIHGALQLAAGMAFDFAGDVNFYGREEAYELDFAGHALSRNARFEGLGARWRLAGDLRVDGVLTLANGEIDLAGANLSCRRLVADAIARGALRLGNSRLEISGNTVNANTPAALIDLTNIELDAAGAVIAFTGAVVDFFLRRGAAVSIGELRFESPVGRAQFHALLSDGLVRVGKLFMASNGNLLGPASIGSLELSPGKVYTLGSGFTYFVDELIAPGVCVAPISLFSSQAGEAANVRSPSGVVQVDFVALRDIHADGDAAFRALNSADLGNNEGWDISGRGDNRLYWVGGTGMWDDPEHWSFSSGGPGGACVPTGGDDVFFDANSFNGPAGTVMINVENAFCRDMIWTGASGMPILMGPVDRNLRIFGSLRLIGNMAFRFEGDVYFESPQAGNVINAAGHTFQKDVFFNGFGGEWRLASPLSAANYIHLQRGALNTADQELSCVRFLSVAATARRLSLGDSRVILRYLANPEFLNWELESVGLIFDAGGSEIRFKDHGILTHRGNQPLRYNNVVFEQYGYLDGRVDDHVAFQEVIFQRTGVIFRSFEFDRLELTRGYEYRMGQQNTQTVRELAARGACDGYISMRSTLDAVPTFIHATQDNLLEYLIIKDVHSVGPGRLRAEQAHDLGNNAGWQFSRAEGRTLYWVGGGGDWISPAHWSLSSGGSGGECIPTPFDDVIFDANSFNAPGQIVNARGLIDFHCRDMTWEGARFDPAFEINQLQLYGNLKLIEAMRANISQLQLKSGRAGNTIDLAGHELGTMVVEGAGDFRMESALKCQGFLAMYHGALHTNDQPLSILNFVAAFEETPKRLELGASHFLVNGPGDRVPTWNVADHNFSLSSGTSVIEFSHPSAWMIHRQPSPLTYHHVIFSATTGGSILEAGGGAPPVFQLLEFKKNAVIKGAHVFDTLIFSPGKSYQLEAGITQTIRQHWRIFGNNCTPIQLSSTRAGALAFATMAEGTVNGDFIQMRDQSAVGGAAFFAGAHSTNIGGSNEGWIFETPAAFVDVGFLGADAVLCEQQTLLLDARSNSANETYLWQDGSVGPSFSVVEPGLYWAQVRFGDNCLIRDSVRVFPPEAFKATLPPDTTLCEGERLLLDAVFEAAGATYLWQDGSAQRTFELSEPGEYRVKITLSGCTDADSIRVDYVAPPVFSLGGDRALCHNTTFTLDASADGATAYRWQDESATTPTFVVSAPGVYWVDAFTGRCARRDSVVIEYLPPIAPDLGSDTVLCDGQTLVLAWPREGVTLRWPNGVEGPDFAVTSPGDYWVDASREGCTERDSIKVRFKPLPAFELGPDLTLCEGESARLNGAAPGPVSYRWNTGATTPIINVNVPGRYVLEAALEGCVRADSVEVRYIVIPPLALGRDTALCEGETLTLDIRLSDATYLWQDGSTSAIYTVRSPGLYWGEVRVGRCNDRDSVVVRYKPLPQASIGNDTLLCEGEPFQLRVQGNGDSFVWSDGAEGRERPLGAPGMYWVDAFLDGCVARAGALIETQDRPLISLGPDTVICHDQTLRLDPGWGGADRYSWQDGSVGRSFQARESGLYWVEIVDGACTVRDSVLVTKVRCNYFQSYVPNAFSPNGDGVNDTWEVFFPTAVQILDFRASVFDRWGNLVFQSADPDVAWDGMFRSRPLPSGVYIYQIEVEYVDDRRRDREVIGGDVLLLR